MSRYGSFSILRSERRRWDSTTARSYAIGWGRSDREIADLRVAKVVAGGEYW